MGMRHDRHEPCLSMFPMGEVNVRKFDLIVTTAREPELFRATQSTPLCQSCGSAGKTNRPFCHNGGTKQTSLRAAAPLLQKRNRGFIRTIWAFLVKLVRGSMGDLASNNLGPPRVDGHD